MNLSVDFTPDPAETDALSQRLFQNNTLKIREYAYEEFLVRSTDDSGELVAGLHGEIGGDWLYIASLWVDEAFRDRGLGTALLAQAEEIALEKHCFGIYLYTYSFQSPGFYERFGYRTFGALENYCTSHSKLFMKKVLAEKDGTDPASEPLE